MPRPVLPTLRARKDLRDRVVVITGAGSGIGRALALACADRGARLAVSDVDADGLAGTTDLLAAAGATGDRVHARLLDVSDNAAFEAYAPDVVDHHGRVNVLVNNAGVALTGPFTDLPYEQMRWIMGVNFWGVVHGTRAFLPHLIASGDGHVVTLSSLFGLLSVPGQSLYNASKYAVRGLTESLREEMLVAGHRVDVTVVHPGGIKTGIARNGRYFGGSESSAEHFDTQLARTSPERAAEVILDGVERRRPRVLIGADAHLMHQFARITGARYQDVIARVAPRPDAAATPAER